MEKDLTLVIVLWPGPRFPVPQVPSSRALPSSADVGEITELPVTEAEGRGCFSVMKHVFIGNSDVQ